MVCLSCCIAAVPSFASQYPGSSLLVLNCSCLSFLLLDGLGEDEDVPLLLGVDGFCCVVCCGGLDSSNTSFTKSDSSNVLSSVSSAV